MKNKLSPLATKLVAAFEPAFAGFHKAESKLNSVLYSEFHSYWNALPETDREKPAAIAFKRAACEAAESMGYQPQWVSRLLVDMDGIFRERAERSNKGVKAGANKRGKAGKPAPLTASQIKSEVDMIRKLAPTIKLTAVQLEAIVLAIMNR